MRSLAGCNLGRKVGGRREVPPMDGGYNSFYLLLGMTSLMVGPRESG